ncbi:PAAR domain-containing protein [Rhizobium sp. KVB221]|uniref:PAAR domain-containing protein n=1 Tax=Rhizobium setariae TaxID=2801340 RepID=A0A936YMG2_9HYPH|nr:PAAR domain-containing protein [Rhizobium setariae]MBL0373108.1 PAAR domain-containing protein [Rhizobium setariae]
MKFRLSVLIGLVLPTFTLAQDIPPCALSGSATVMIGGRPALRLADVANCPPALYETIDSVHIDGQPMVFFKSGKSGGTTCVAKADSSITVEGKPAQGLGDVGCSRER